MAAHHNESHAHDAAAHAEHEPHAVPLWLLATVFVALLFLTWLTVSITRVDGNQVNIGSFNIMMALLIAVVKAALVCLYFMHLRWDSPFNAVILIASLLFVALFIGFTIVDTSAYKPNLTPPTGAEPPAQITPAGA